MPENNTVKLTPRTWHGVSSVIGLAALRFGEESGALIGKRFQEQIVSATSQEILRSCDLTPYELKLAEIAFGSCIQRDRRVG